MAADNGGVGPDAGPLLQEGPAVFAFALDKCPGINHVGEHAGGAKKHAVLADNPSIDGHIVLNLDPLPQFHAGGDYHVLPDVAAPSDVAARHDVREMPDFRACPNRTALVDAA